MSMHVTTNFSLTKFFGFSISYLLEVFIHRSTYKNPYLRLTETLMKSLQPLGIASLMPITLQGTSVLFICAF